MGIDNLVLNFFLSHQFDWLTLLMLSATYAGGFTMIINITLLSAISFYIHKHYIQILPLFLATGGAALTTAILKVLVDRSRPPLSYIFYSDSDPSFPSGHATASMALYGFLIYAISKYDKHPLKNISVFLLSVLIILIGVSRLYLGVHYFSDVVAGYAIGLGWIFIASWLEKKTRKLLSWKPKV